MTASRPLSPAEREAIAQRYDARCDVQAVTVCKPGATTPWDDIGHKGALMIKRKRDKGLARVSQRYRVPAHVAGLSFAQRQ